MSDGLYITLVLEHGRHLTTTHEVTLATVPQEGAFIKREGLTYAVTGVLTDLDAGSITVLASRTFGFNVPPGE